MTLAAEREVKVLTLTFLPSKKFREICDTVISDSNFI